MQSTELEFKMQQLFVASLAWEWILGKGMTPLFNKPLALLRKL
jgi:hypothetical protein